MTDHIDTEATTDTGYFTDSIDQRSKPFQGKFWTILKWAMIPVILAPVYYIAMHTDTDPSGNEITMALTTITNAVAADVEQLAAGDARTYGLKRSTVTVQPPVKTESDRYTYHLEVVAGDAYACRAALGTMLPLVNDFTLGGKVYQTASSISYRVGEGRLSRTYNPGTDRCNGETYPLALGFDPTVTAD